MPSRRRSLKRLRSSALWRTVARSSSNARCVPSETFAWMKSVSNMDQQPSASSNVLTGLPADLLGSLFAKGRPVSLASDQTLFLPGDPPEGCYRVDEGLLKVCVVTPAGGERILAILGAGAMIGDLSMIDGSPRSALGTA